MAGRADSLLTPSALAKRVTPDNPTIFRVATIPTGRSPTYATVPRSTADVIDKRQSASAVRRPDPTSSRVSRRERHQPCTMTTHKGTTAALGTSTPLPVKNGGIVTMTSEVSPMRTQQTTVAASKDNRDRFRAHALQPSTTLRLNMSEAGLDLVQECWPVSRSAIDRWISTTHEPLGTMSRLAPRCRNVPPTKRQHAPGYLPPRSPLGLYELGMEQQPCHLRLLTVWVLPIQTHSLLTPTTKRLFESIVQCPADIPLEHESR